jgi:hypothetical protein
MTQPFDQLASILSNNGFGRLQRVEPILRKSIVVADDLRGGEDLELLRFDLTETVLCFLSKGRIH